MSATRRAVLIAGGGALLAPAAAARAAAPGDAAVLQRLLALERRLEGAYDLALRDDRFDAATARRLRDQEREHIRGLELTLSRMGRRPRRGEARGISVPPGETFARFAFELESRTVAAYLDGLAQIRNSRLLLPLGSIAANQGQHIVILRDSLGLPPLDGSLAVG